MGEYDKKPPANFDPPSITQGPDSLGPKDPIHIPNSDWSVQPGFSPFMDDPSPHSVAPSGPLDRGGTPSGPPAWWVDEPPTLRPVPDNPFLPEEQQKTKEKRAREAAERKRLEDLEKQPASDDRGDFPEHQGDLYFA